MTTTTKSRSTAKAAKSTPAPASRKSPAPAAKSPAKSEAPAPAKTSSTYREVADFGPALKAARSLSKGNPDLAQPLQLITHLAWKTPGGTVGWAKGTTATVIAFADDIAVPTGTPIPDAMSAALSAAEKGAADKPQKDAVAVLAKVVRSHS